MKHDRERLLILPLRRRRQRDNQIAQARHHRIRQKPDPDDAPRTAIAVHFRKNVAEDVGDGKQQLRAADAEGAERANLLAHQIGNHQHHDEDAGKKIVVLENSGLFSQAPIIEETPLETGHGHAPSVFSASPVALNMSCGNALRSTSASPCTSPVSSRSLTTLARSRSICGSICVDERAILIGKTDAGVMRRRAYPDLLAVESPRPLPNSQMMPRREGVVDFFKHQIGRTAVQQQHRNRRLLISAHLRHGAEGFELRLIAQLRRRRPTSLLKRVFNLLPAPQEHQRGDIGRSLILLCRGSKRLAVHQTKELVLRLNGSDVRPLAEPVHSNGLVSAMVISTPGLKSILASASFSTACFTVPNSSANDRVLFGNLVDPLIQPPGPGLRRDDAQNAAIGVQRTRAHCRSQ